LSQNTSDILSGAHWSPAKVKSSKTTSSATAVPLANDLNEKRRNSSSAAKAVPNIASKISASEKAAQPLAKTVPSEQGDGYSHSRRLQQREKSEHNGQRLFKNFSQLDY
jgi:hypothetical protein